MQRQSCQANLCNQLTLRYHKTVNLLDSRCGSDRRRRWADKSEDHNTRTKNTEWISTRRGWKEEIARTWNSFFVSLGSEKLSCPCGKMGSNQPLEEDFRAAHLFESLLSKPKPRPRGGVSATAGTISHRGKRRRRRSDSSME
jgi:hypothetical protein